MRVWGRLTASQSLLDGVVCTPIQRGLPFARARRHGLRSMSGRYSYGIDNPPTLRRSSFPQRVVRPVGVPYSKTRSGVPRDPDARRAQPTLKSGRPSAMLRAALSAVVRPPLPTRSCDLAGTPICPLGKPKGGFPKRRLNGAYRVSATHFYRPRAGARRANHHPCPLLKGGGLWYRWANTFGAVTSSLGKSISRTLSPRPFFCSAPPQFTFSS